MKKTMSSPGWAKSRRRRGPAPVFPGDASSRASSAASTSSGETPLGMTLILSWGSWNCPASSDSM